MKTNLFTYFAFPRRTNTVWIVQMSKQFVHVIFAMVIRLKAQSYSPFSYSTVLEAIKLIFSISPDFRSTHIHKVSSLHVIRHIEFYVLLSSVLLLTRLVLDLLGHLLMRTDSGTTNKWNVTLNQTAD